MNLNYTHEVLFLLYYMFVIWCGLSLSIYTYAN
jgi:hypothetical protein